MLWRLWKPPKTPPRWTNSVSMMGRLSAEERPVMGQLANAVRADIEEKLEERKTALSAAALEAKLACESIDVTIPGDTVELGQTIGCVGNSALLESALGDHLHFAVTCNGESMDPAAFLQAE